MMTIAAKVEEVLQGLHGGFSAHNDEADYITGKKDGSARGIEASYITRGSRIYI